MHIKRPDPFRTHVRVYAVENSSFSPSVYRLPRRPSPAECYEHERIGLSFFPLPLSWRLVAASLPFFPVPERANQTTC